MSSGETILNNRYVLKAQQGSGGMAVIYRAVDKELGRTVAVKILRPSLTTDPTFLARFRNEARAVANLSHPNIVTVHDVGNDGPTHYIVMEYVEGQDLKKIIRTEGVLSVKRSLNLAIQICAGIGFAHRAALVHADVKPQNILVTSDDRVKVTDFGIAQALTDTQPMTRQEVVWGSPHYFAPEQARGEKPTPAADVYAIGIVMFEMLTGRLPYVGASQQELALAHVKERVPMVSEFNASIPENLSKIVYKVMSKEPSARYRMADQLGHVLQSYQERARDNTVTNSPPEIISPPVSSPPQNSAPQSPARPPNIPAPVQKSASQPVQPSQSIPQPPGQFSQARPPVVPGAPPRLPGESTAEPTQRYGPAPQPLPPANVNRPAQRSAEPSQGFQPIAPTPWQEPRSESGRFYTRPEPEAPAGLDVVTIALAIIAFFAVACLIPLYIAVFQARFGG
jgi:serine/threonine-protein kinase